LSVLTSADFQLTEGNDVRVKIIATNVKGDSEESDVGSGAIIINAPDAPVDLSEDTLLRDPTTIGLMWNEGSSDGGTLVTEYRINMAE
jgi:hypothetical protein